MHRAGRILPEKEAAAVCSVPSSCRRCKGEIGASRFGLLHGRRDSATGRRQGGAGQVRLDVVEVVAELQPLADKPNRPRHVDEGRQRGGKTALGCS
jgi:hypothetical protein